MSWYKLAQSREIELYHLSNEDFSSFSNDYAIGGQHWFAEDRESLLENKHGANLRSDVPVYLYTVIATLDKTANREEYDKYMIDQLTGMGYDSIYLEGDYIVLDPSRIRITNKEVI